MMDVHDVERKERWLQRICSRCECEEKLKHANGKAYRRNTKTLRAFG